VIKQDLKATLLGWSQPTARGDKKNERRKAEEGDRSKQKIELIQTCRRKTTKGFNLEGKKAGELALYGKKH